MIIFLNTQKENTAADKFFKALISKCNLKYNIINERNKGLFSILNISRKINNLINNTETNYKLISDCGTFKLWLIFLINNLYQKKIKLYTTYYHHIFNFKECYYYNQANESWKLISLYIYKYALLRMKLFDVNFLTVSQFTKNILINKFKVSESNVYVLWNQIFDNDLIASHKIYNINYKKQQPFILIVSSLIKRKNLKLIRNLSSIYQKKIKFVCPYPKSRDQLDFIDYLRKNKVRIYHNLKDKDLFDLYNKANCVLVPSLYEGLSIVPLEAISSSAPMILSNINTHLYWGLSKTFYFEIDKLEQLILKLNKYLLQPKKTINYSKFPQLIKNLKSASIERSNNLKMLFDDSNF